MSSVRDLSRLARRVPLVRTALEASDPRRRAERLIRLGIIDTALYAAQLGVAEIDESAAAAHYVSAGHDLGYTLNVLIDPYVAARGMTPTGRPSIYDYFNGKSWQTVSTEVWSSGEYAKQYPESLMHPSGPIGHLWDRVQHDPTTTVTVNLGGGQQIAWSDLYPVLFAATEEWATIQRMRDARAMRPDLPHPESLAAAAGTAHGARVSIIMPVWNRGGGLRRAVESILAQAWQDWELLIVDDGSWDDTLAVAELLVARDDRIRLIRREHGGVCAARNAGISAASGEYIAFLDSDNTWLPTYLRDMVTSMAGEGLSAAYASIEVDDGESIRYRHGDQDRESLLLGNSIDLNTLIVRRDVVESVGAFDISLRRAVDYDLILKVAEVTTIAHVPTLGARYDNSDESTDRISTSEARGWNTAVRLRHAEAPASTVSTDATIVALFQSADPTLAAKLDALEELRSEDREIVIAGVGMKPDEWRRIRTFTHLHPDVVARIHQEGEAFAYVVNLELRRSRSAVLTVIDPRSVFDASSIEALVEEVRSARSDAAIPLTIATDGTVESLGTTFVGRHGLPAPLLVDHPAEDARRLESRVLVDGLSGRTFAIDRTAFDEVGGLDPLLFNEHELAGMSRSLTDKKLAVRSDITFVQVADVRAFNTKDPGGTAATLRGKPHAWTGAGTDSVYGPLGLRVMHWRQTDTNLSEEFPRTDPAESSTLRPVVVRDRRDVEVGGRTVPRLRWAIKTASPAGPVGETWGDTHFGRSLASALESLGQEAVVDAREAQRRETDYLDDVVIHLRGLDEFVPSPATLSYLWVISHPDMVSRAEAQRFDRVFAASLSWSAQQSLRWGIPVEALLQCTDPERFHPGPAAPRLGTGGPLFVGNSRGVPRPTVMESVRAGLPLDLYGGDWKRFIPADAITGERVDNAELGKLYATASVVLNDHWADMQREGFISNRLFDVVAAGGRAFSDDVPGIDQIFGGAVQTYDAVSEIVPFLESDLDERFPDADALGGISERIREEHSFAARARILLDRAIADLAAQGRR
ncbi:glycosyltransferase [Microbacterium sp. NPDC008134]|uniref:glycosyltransferase n=1 Tax=Microbacterium sp. NPDC008134 TaxID=3364183 RepID=UPI0036E3FF1F